jgi:cysteine desulfurase
MNVPAPVAQGALRLSLSRYSTDADIDRTVEVLPTVVEKLRAVRA